MADSRMELISKATEYCQRRKLELLQDVLGFGVHGSVFVCKYHSQITGRAAINAIKIHERREPYLRERDVYLRLKELQIESIQGHAIPQLIATTTNCWSLRCRSCRDLSCLILVELIWIVRPTTTRRLSRSGNSINKNNLKTTGRKPYRSSAGCAGLAFTSWT